MIGEIIGGLVGQDHAQAGFDAQKSAINQMIAKLDSVGMPPDQSAAVILEKYKQAGIMTPQLESMVKDSVSEYSEIKSDPALRDTQVEALKQMSQYGKAGFNEGERAANRLAQADVQRQNESNQQSIIQNMLARGQGGSGAELAARMTGAQSNANNASEEADRMSMQAAQRALQAISASSGMANQLRGQDFSEDSTKASAADEMNRFNVQNQMNIGQRNVGSANQAQAANLANLQQVNNANVQGTNTEKYAQLERQRQNWVDKLNYAQAYQSPLNQYGVVGQAAEQSKAKMAAGFGKTFDNTAWNIVGMMAGKPPTKPSSDQAGGDDPSKNSGTT